MVDYKNGKIYKLVSNETDKIYIGSTCRSLRKRFFDHKDGFNSSKKSDRYVSSFTLFKLGPVDIILIENYPCDDKQQLHARERYWIEFNKGITVNLILPTRTREQYRHENKEIIAVKSKEYGSKNKAMIAVKTKKYRNVNDKKIKEFKNKNNDCLCGGKYAHCHKALHLRSELHQKYANKNDLKEEILDIQLECVCGGKISPGNETRHNKSLKHQKYAKENDIKKDLLDIQKECVCGGKISPGNETRHIKSLKHLKYLNETKQDTMIHIS